MNNSHFARAMPVQMSWAQACARHNPIAESRGLAERTSGTARRWTHVPKPLHSSYLFHLSSSAISSVCFPATIMTDVLVIGSGWAGTYASLLLAQQGKKVFVLEARERLGGRMFTHSWTPESIASSDPEVRGARTAVAGKSGVRHTIDLGGAWAHGFHEGSPLLKLASKYSAPIEVAKPTATKIVGPKGTSASSHVHNQSLVSSDTSQLLRRSGRHSRCATAAEPRCRSSRRTSCGGRHSVWESG